MAEPICFITDVRSDAQRQQALASLEQVSFDDGKATATGWSAAIGRAWTTAAMCTLRLCRAATSFTLVLSPAASYEGGELALKTSSKLRRMWDS